MAPGIRKSEKDKAFEREAIPHTALLYNYALRMTGNTPDADDLLQETFLKAYRFWEKYEQGTNIRAWLCRIMKNSYINRYRKEIKEPTTVGYEEVEGFYASVCTDSGSLNDLQQSLTNNLLDDDVASAIADLPEEFRTVVILCDIEGLSYEEIAELVDIPLGTVRSRLHRGRKLLRDRLLNYARKRTWSPWTRWTPAIRSCSSTSGPTRR